MSYEGGLLERLAKREARIGVLGLGYVGLPLATHLAEAGFPTMVLDVKREIVDGVRDGQSHIGDVDSAQVAALVADGTLDASTDFDRLAEMDVIIICVPTPLSKVGDPDVSFIVSAAEQVKARLRPGQLIILESTTYPGTTRELLQKTLEETGLAAGKDFFLAFSPERVDPGNAEFTIHNTPKIVGGLTPGCHKLAVALYRQIVDEVVEVSCPEAAELAKLLENTFRAVNIGLVNEMAVIADRLGINIWEVVDAASTKPYGFMRFTPGPGLGGHCIPVDPQYLAWKMRSLRYRTRFIELAAEVNAEMPRYVVSKTAEALNVAGKAVNGSRVLLLGLSYKADVDDTRESPALDVHQLLREMGAVVSYHDPYVASVRIEGEPFESVPLTAEALEATDAVVVTTDHRDVDYDLVLERAKIIVDPRNALEGKIGRAVIYPVAGPPRQEQPVAVGVGSASS